MLTRTLGEEHLAFWAKHLNALQCYVYVVQGEEGGPVKIGRARKPYKRIAELQTGNPHRLRLLYVVPGDAEVEWQLHRRLRGSRLVGEWFDGPRVERVLALIEQVTQQMIEDHSTNGVPPELGDYMELYSRPRRAEQGVVVRFVAPAPVDPEEAKRRLAARWMRPARRGSPLEAGGDTGTIC